MKKTVQKKISFCGINFWETTKKMFYWWIGF